MNRIELLDKIKEIKESKIFLLNLGHTIIFLDNEKEFNREKKLNEDEIEEAYATTFGDMARIECITECDIDTRGKIIQKSKDLYELKIKLKLEENNKKI